MDWSDLTNAPAMSSHIVALLKACKERLACFGLETNTSHSFALQEQIDDALATDLQGRYYKLGYGSDRTDLRCIHRSIDALIPKAANPSKESTWDGAGPSYSLSLNQNITASEGDFAYTEADILADIGDASRVPEPSRYDPLIAAWAMQSYKLLNRLKWHVHDERWQRTTADALRRYVTANYTSRASAEAEYAATPDSTYNGRPFGHEPTAWTSEDGSPYYKLGRQSHGTYVIDPNNWCQSEGYAQEIDCYVFARVARQSLPVDPTTFYDHGDGYTEDTWHAVPSISGYLISQADWIADGNGAIDLPLIPNNQSATPTVWGALYYYHGYRLPGVVNIRKFDITNGLRFIA